MISRIALSLGIHDNDNDDGKDQPYNDDDEYDDDDDNDDDKQHHHLDSGPRAKKHTLRSKFLPVVALT